MTEAAVGQWTAAPGAEDIVTGKALYCPDIRLPGLLCGKLLYSPYARARIKKLDVRKSRKLPGVFAVITHADIPGESLNGTQASCTSRHFMPIFAATAAT